MKILIIGAGTIGLPFGLLLSKAGHQIDFADVNSERLALLSAGEISFLSEKNLGPLFLDCNKSINFIHPDQIVNHYDCLVFTANIGNQVDEALKLYRQYSSLCQKSELVLFRSTLNKQQWDCLQSEIPAERFAYIPERSRPGNILNEIKSTPQIIGHESRLAFNKSYEILGSIVDECLEASVLEAISIKLLTNSWRTSVFNLANQFFIDCHKRGISFEKVTTLAKKNYPRLDSLPEASFISGPCLPKDYLSWKDWELASPRVENPLNQELLQLFLSALLTKYSHLKNKKIALFGDSYRRDYQVERGEICQTVSKLLIDLGAEVKTFQSDQKNEITKWKADLVINMFPKMEKMNQIEQFDFWSNQ